MVLTNWISLALTTALVGATWYYAREVKRQSEQIRRQQKRPKILELVDEGLLTIDPMLLSRPRYTEVEKILSQPTGDTEETNPSEDFINVTPIELSSVQKMVIATNEDRTEDILDLFEEYEEEIEELHEAVTNSFVRLYTETQETEEFVVLRAVAPSVWDGVLGHIIGRDIDISNAALPNGISNSDFSFFEMPVRIVEHRMNELDDNYEYIVNLWIEALEAIEDADSDSDLKHLTWLSDVDEALTELANQLDQLAITQRSLENEVERLSRELIDEFDIRPSEVEYPSHLQAIYEST